MRANRYPAIDKDSGMSIRNHRDFATVSYEYKSYKLDCYKCVAACSH